MPDVTLFFPVYGDERTVRSVTEKALTVLAEVADRYEVVIVDEFATFAKLCRYVMFASGAYLFRCLSAVSKARLFQCLVQLDLASSFFYTES